MDLHWRDRLARSHPGLRVHLIGIGGSGLAPIAQVLLQQGIQVSGSDVQASARTQALAAQGARIHLDQSGDPLRALPAEERPHVVLISSAIGPDNPERATAAALGIPVVKRREFLGALLGRRQTIAVAGSHGKSTTTAMIVQILHQAGVDAGYIIGAELPGYGHSHWGTHPSFVIEADEYDRMFLGLTPHIAVLTNVDWDHPDCYPSPASFRRAFMQFVDRVHREGAVISCGDDPGAEALRAFAPTRGRWLTYGLTPHVDVRGEALEPTPQGGIRARVRWWGAPLGELELQVPGHHNVRNALAALVVARHCGVEMAQALESLARFPGVARRFEHKGTQDGVTVVDDYAHHPAEIRATLAAARQRYRDRPLWAVFQPHTFSRTQTLLQALAESFHQADHALITDIYPAREQDRGQIHAQDLVAASSHPSIQYTGSLTATVEHLLQAVAPGHVVVTLGAGDVTQVGEELLARLAQQPLQYAL